MSKEFNCPSCSAPMIYEGGESIFQTCEICNAPIVVPSDIYYKKEVQLASEDFASLVNEKEVNVEQVTNELTPGRNLPKSEDVIDPEARIEKFEVYQKKIGTDAVETKKAVDEIISPKEKVSFQPDSPYKSPFELGENPLEIVKEKPPVDRRLIDPSLVRVKNELQMGNKIEAIKLFRSKFKTDLRTAKESVEAIERGENIDISIFKNEPAKE